MGIGRKCVGIGFPGISVGSEAFPCDAFLFLPNDKGFPGVAGAFRAAAIVIRDASRAFRQDEQVVSLLFQ